MKLEYSILAISSILLIVGCGGGNTTDPSVVSADTAIQTTDTQSTATNPYPAELMTDDEITAFLKVINDARNVEQDCGTKGVYAAAPALSWNNELYLAAYEHSNDLGVSDTFSHDGSGTDSDWTGMETGTSSTVTERIENNGYTNWNKVGENIAAGTDRDTPEEAVAAWIESDGHCAILMDPGYSEVGMAMVKNSQSTYTYYWTQNFGNR